MLFSAFGCLFLYFSLCGSDSVLSSSRSPLCCCWFCSVHVTSNHMCGSSVLRRAGLRAEAMWLAKETGWNRSAVIGSDTFQSSYHQASSDCNTDLSDCVVQFDIIVFRVVLLQSFCEPLHLFIYRPDVFIWEYIWVNFSDGVLSVFWSWLSFSFVSEHFKPLGFKGLH